MLAAILFLPFQADALSAEKAILIDGDTGHVLYEKSADDRSLIASTTKIMTALIVSEQCNVLDRVRIPAHAVGIEGSSIYLKEGEILTVQELLYGLMLHSGNDAAVALAIYCGGTIEGFTQLMNDKASVLGMHSTHFQNPHGLDHPQHYSTARDLAVLAAYAMKNPIFSQTVSTKSVSISGRKLQNHNKLLWRIEGNNGVKTGFTRAAGRILVSSTVLNGRQLIAATINAPNDWQDHATLVGEGFKHYSPQLIIEKDSCLGYTEVSGGDNLVVPLLAAEGFTCSIADWESPEVVLQERSITYAPISAGEEAGIACVQVDGAIIGKIPIVYGQTIERTEIKKVPFWKKLFGCD